MSDLEDEGSTTDMGHGCTSDTEDSGLSGTECSRVDAPQGRCCHFGSSSLETVPATPGGICSHASITSPTRAAMLQARDACKVDVLPDASKSTSSSNTAVMKDVTACRFESTSLGTVPATPPSAVKWKCLAQVFGSPPGLSRASMR